MIRAIVFDTSEIVIKEEAVRARSILCKKFNIDEEKFKNFVLRNLQYSYRGMSSRIFFGKLIKELKVNADVEELIAGWELARKKTSRVNRFIKNLVQKLRKKYFVASISDTTRLNDRVRKKLGVYKLFDLNLISYEEKSTKSEEKFYRIMIDKLKKRRINKEEIIYIDDSESCIKIAKKAGMNTILYKDDRQLNKKLKKLT